MNFLQLLNYIKSSTALELQSSKQEMIIRAQI